ncbi:MAG: hypothetical protein IJW75_03115 [Alphaproteobacteria bacterium]|nr:hypothetical protein [Alphaproteobacteria bacterium]
MAGFEHCAFGSFFKKMVKSYLNMKVLKEIKKRGPRVDEVRRGFVVKVDENGERRVEEVERYILPF